MIFEIIEPYLEVFNLVMAIIIVIIGSFILGILTSNLKKAWAYFLIAIGLFGLHEVIGSLAEFNIFEIEGLYAFTEFLFIIAFFVSILAFRNLFFKLSKNKK